MKIHTCCQDDFSTLSWKLRCLTATSVIFSTFCFLCLAIYYFILRDETSLQDAMLLSQPEVWKPNCPEIPVDPENRLDCYPEDSNVSQDTCALRGCCWANSTNLVPKCYYSLNHGYKAVSQKTSYDGFEVSLSRLSAPSRYGDDVHNVKMKVEVQTSTRLRIKFYDPENERYEVPTPIIPVEKSSFDPGYEVPLYAVAHNIGEVPYAVNVRRVATDEVIFGILGYSFIFSSQFLEITVKLPSENVYGFGEHFHGSYKHSFNWKKWSMFSSDVTYQDCNMHGVQPMYLCVENGGTSHGVLFLNSNAMEVLLQPMPSITFRTIGGVLDFYIFLGPTPEDVVKQYTEAVGRPMMPPYWALGYQIGQRGGDNFVSVVDRLKKMRSKDVAQDILYIETEPGGNNETDVLTLLQDLKSKHLKSVVLMTPEVAKGEEYIGGLGSGIFINSTWGTYPLIGMSRSENVTFLDFGNPITEVWWQERIRSFHEEIPFHGVWLGDNTPINISNESLDECYQDNLNKPFFIPTLCTQDLYEGTICMDAVQYWKEKKYRHYDLHNLYGHLMSVATHNVLKKLFENDRPLVCTQSTFVGTGKYAGHWIHRDIDTWEDLKKIIPIILEFNIFGIPYVGINICTSNINDELCMRQIQLGAFYPLAFSYISETIEVNSSSTLDLDYVTRQALRRRYELLPYLYTLFHNAHINGSTVVRPLFHEFPEDEKTYSIDQQFLWGSSLLISPILDKEVTSILIYLPKGIWYDYYSGEKFQLENGEFLKMPYHKHRLSKPVNLHIRGGHIIPTQQAANTTNISRKQPMGLIVALNSSNEAEGTLFWDNGATIESYPTSEHVKVKFTVSKNTFVIEGSTGQRGFHPDFSEVHIQHVRVMGLSHKPLRITIGNTYTLQKKHIRWNTEYKSLQLRHVVIPLSGKTIVQWFL